MLSPLSYADCIDSFRLLLNTCLLAAGKENYKHFYKVGLHEPLENIKGSIDVVVFLDFLIAETPHHIEIKSGSVYHQILFVN